MSAKVPVSIGVFAYNEETTVGPLLDSLRNQMVDTVSIEEIIVVSSACRDRTDEIVKDHAVQDGRVCLVTEEERKGKINAINLFLKKASSPVVVVTSADVLSMSNTIENLCRPFSADPKLGLTSGNPVPVNDAKTFLGYVIHFWWYAHNRLPRHGEIIAFRNVLPALDPADILDEASVEAALTARDYHFQHCDDAVVRNRGADSIGDLIKQRRRNHAGHIIIRRTKAYAVASLSYGKVMRITWEFWRRSPTIIHALWLLGGMMIEQYSKLLGRIDVIFRRHEHAVWDIASSTKKGWGP